MSDFFYLFGGWRDVEFDWLVSVVVVFVKGFPLVQWH